MSFVRDEHGRLRWTRVRRASQLAFLLFFLLLPVTYRWGQTVVLGTLASLKVGPISLVDPACAASTMLASQAASWTLLNGVLLPVMLAMWLGPVFCSWVCPWGLVTEMLDRLLRRGPTKIPSWLPALRWSSLAAVSILSLALGVPMAALLSAPRAISILPLEVVFLGGASAGTLGLLGLLLLIELVLPRRLWCRALCPVGSTLVLLRNRRTVDIRWSAAVCEGASCGLGGHRVCPWNLDPRRTKAYDGCTNCGRCVELCPVQPVPAQGFGRGGRGRGAPKAGLPILPRSVARG